MVSFLLGYLSPLECLKAQCLGLFYLYSVYINGISSVVSNSTVKLFAGDVTIYKEIVFSADVDLLQCDLTKVVAWARTWLLHLNPEFVLNCFMYLVS